MKAIKDGTLGKGSVAGDEYQYDLQQARVYFTALGDDKAQKSSARALERAAGFLRRQIGVRLRLKQPDPRVKAGMYATVKRLGQWS